MVSIVGWTDGGTDGWTDGGTDFFVELFGTKDCGAHRTIGSFRALIIVDMFIAHAAAAANAFFAVVRWMEGVSFSLFKNYVDEYIVYAR